MIYAGTDFKEDNAWKGELEGLLRRRYSLKRVGFSETSLNLFFENGVVLSISMSEVKHLLKMQNGIEYLCLKIDYDCKMSFRV